MPFNIILGRNEADKKKFGEEGTILLGRSYVQMGRTVSLSNYVYLDVIKSHVVFVVGKRGCLSEETLIFTDKGFKPIKEYNEKKDKIYSFNKENYKWIWEKAKLLRYPIINEQLLEISTYDGQRLILTKEHPLLVLEHNKLTWKKAYNLKENDLLINITQLPEIKKNKENSRIARILGFTLADGTIFVKKGVYKDRKGYLYNGTKKRLRITNASENVLEQAKKDIETEFDVPVRIYKRKDCNAYNLENSNSKLVDKIIKLGVPIGKKSHKIRVPQIVFESSNDFKANFISALISCDGYVNKNGYPVIYCSKSIDFLKDLNLILLHFGIQSTIRKKMAKSNGKSYLNYLLNITDHQSLENLKKIGIIDHEKDYKLNKHKFHQLKRRKVGNYFAKDVYATKIVSIIPKDGIKQVYDLSVPKNNSFIANGIISHNSGKSYSSSVIAEGIVDLPEDVSKNLSVIMFDSMGVYWTMKYPNEKDNDLLEQWGLKPKGLEKIKIFTPEGQFEQAKEHGIPSDYPFSIQASELTGEDWRLAFELPTSHPVSILIEKILGDFAENKNDNYSIDTIIEYIKNDNTFSNDTKNEAINRFKGAKQWGLISNKGTKIDVLVQRGSVSVLDLSAYASSSGGWGIKALVIGLVAKKVFIERMASRQIEEVEAIRTGYSYFKLEEESETTEKKPLVWFIVDECLPAESMIETDKGKQKIIDIVKKFENNKKTKVLSFDTIDNTFKFKEVTNIYRKGTKELIIITTETGKRIKCTSNHKLLTSKGFEEAQHSLDIATPLIYNYSKNKNLIKARLLGHIFGDGYLSKNGTCVGFSGKGNIEDLNKIKEDLSELNLSSSKIYTKETNSIITDIQGHTHIVNGTSQEVRSSTNCHKIFKELGAPIGKKTNTGYSIPKWLKDASCEEISEFLAALMGADGIAPSMNKNCKRDFNPIRISFNYVNSKEEQANLYAEELKELFNKIGIEISSITKKDGNIRKDNSTTSKRVLTLSKNTPNTILFLERIGYRYCKKKEKSGKQWLNYLKAKLFEENKQNILKQKARILHIEKGLGKVKIAKELNIPIHQARDWINPNINWKTRAPYSFQGFKEWSQTRTIGENLFENITSRKIHSNEEVFDLSVESTHNFIADDFVVHNCHEYLPVEGKTAATDALVTILREGRQPGLSLLLITQQPGKIHSDVLTQSDIVLAHRLTAKRDVDALNSMMQSYLGNSLTGYLDMLPAEGGAAIILDDNSERLYPIRVRPKFSWHGGEAPTAIKYKKSANLGI